MGCIIVDDEALEIIRCVPHGVGKVTCDIAYGGMFYVIVDAASVGQTGIVERFILRSVNRVPGAPPLEELFKTQHPQLGSVRRRFFSSSPALRSTSFGLEFL